MRQRLMGTGVLAAVIALTGCGGDEEALQTPGAASATRPMFPGMPVFGPGPVASPSTPNPTATPGQGGPSPTATPTVPTTPTATPAAPQPTATPTAPTPTPTAAPPSGQCSLPSMPDGSSCGEEHPHFNDDVNAAVRQIRDQRPELFKPDGKKVKEQFYDEYVRGVADILKSYGYCAAQGGPDDEVAVKTKNDWNDQYDVLMGDGTSWVAYTVTCRPSRF